MSEMGQGHSGASGIGWWGPSWKLVTWESPRSSAAEWRGVDAAGPGKLPLPGEPTGGPLCYASGHTPIF